MKQKYENVKLPTELVDSLRKYKEKTGVPITAAISALVKKFLKGLK